MILDSKQLAELIQGILLNIPDFVRVTEKYPSGSECKGWMDIPLNESMINSRRRSVTNYVLSKHPESKDRVAWNRELMVDFMRAYDLYFYDSQLEKRLREKGVKVEYTLGSSNNVFGYCKKKNECYYEIQLTDLLLGNRLFSGKEKSYIVNGLEVFNHFSYVQSIFEHELAHLIVNVFCPEAPVLRRGVYRTPMHGPNFKRLVYSTYHQTEIKGHLETTKSVLERENKRDVIRELSPGDPVLSKNQRSVIQQINRKKAVFVYLSNIDRPLTVDLSGLVPIDEKELTTDDKKALDIFRRRLRFQENLRVGSRVRDITNNRVGVITDVKRSKVYVNINSKLFIYSRYALSEP